MTNYILGSRRTNPITQPLAMMCVACFWVLTACSDPPSATRTGVVPYEDGELIAYVQYSGNNPDIYVVHPDGTRPRQLTTNPGLDLFPAWSPDGKRIAFSSMRDGSVGILVMDDDGANQLRLTSGNDFGPAWSPDGSRIAFRRDSAIWLMNADGTNAVPLVGGSLYGSGHDWSPDGKRIAFSREGNGISGIWTIDADGSNPVRVTSQDDSKPAWSPDGKAIAFNRYHAPLDDYDQESYAIYVMNADGSALWQLTNRGRAGGSVGTPTWKGDGRTIAFSGSTCVGCLSKLWLVDTQSLAVTQIPTPWSAYSPAWRR